VTQSQLLIGPRLSDGLTSHPRGVIRLPCQPQAFTLLDTRAIRDSSYFWAHLVPLIPNQGGGMYSSNRDGSNNRIARTKLCLGQNLDCVLCGVCKASDSDGFRSRIKT